MGCFCSSASSAPPPAVVRSRPEGPPPPIDLYFTFGHMIVDVHDPNDDDVLFYQYSNLSQGPIGIKRDAFKCNIPDTERKLVQVPQEKGQRVTNVDFMNAYAPEFSKKKREYIEAQDEAAEGA